MNVKKLFVSGVAGGITYFFLGFLFYGVWFVNDTLSSVAGVNRQMDQMIWWSLILGSLLYGILVAFVIGKSNITNVVSGFATSAVVGLLVSASYNFTIYANTNLVTPKIMTYDIAISTAMVALTGVVVTLVGKAISKKA
ncbi:MAG: hypothetical protein QM541_06300 [Flavobacterium sp.]|nr:hypothetical protein [Flavobacterium sp.]